FRSFLHFSSPCLLMADTLFSSAWTRMLREVCKSAVSLFLGGVYFLLGVVAFYLFSRRSRDTPGRSIFMSAIGLMLVLAMAELAAQVVATSLSLRMLYRAVDGSLLDTAVSVSQQQEASLQGIYDKIVFAEDLMLVANNALADGLFAYRCYLIWGPKYNKYIIILPCISLVITTALGGTAAYYNNIRFAGSSVVDTRIGFAFAITTNVMLTGLTAGRIWWTRRELRIVGQDKYTKRYTTAISVLVESGLAYSVFLILVIAAVSYGRHSSSTDPGPLALISLSYGAAGQLVNIVPTAFIVRIGLFPPSETEGEKFKKFLV
ncbi:hypothetical protein R3P38DRAFT_2506200, partial [Favolaschia claudopus]